MTKAIVHVEDSTRAIVQSLDTHNKLEASMRAGILKLVEYFRQLWPEIDELKDIEYDLRLIDIQTELEHGWRIVVQRMELGGRRFKNQDGADLVAKHHMIVSQGIVGYEQTVGGDVEADMTIAAIGLAAILMKVTTPSS